MHHCWWRDLMLVWVRSCRLIRFNFLYAAHCWVLLQKMQFLIQWLFLLQWYHFKFLEFFLLDLKFLFFIYLYIYFFNKFFFYYDFSWTGLRTFHWNFKLLHFIVLDTVSYRLHFHGMFTCKSRNLGP